LRSAIVGSKEKRRIAQEIEIVEMTVSVDVTTKGIAIPHATTRATEIGMIGIETSTATVTVTGMTIEDIYGARMTETIETVITAMDAPHPTRATATATVIDTVTMIAAVILTEIATAMHPEVRQQRLAHLLLHLQLRHHPSAHLHLHLRLL
jgi:hypothetical protein